MVRMLERVATCGCAFILSGCATVFFERTQTGTFSGRLDVEWIAPNQFIYRVHPTNPLTFVTPDGKVIRPRTMYTDGGSIPRLFWSSPMLGPWDFAPGYIIHDWLFEQHHCKEGEDWKDYDVDRAALVLAQAIKTQMVKGEGSDPVVVYAIYEAVRTPVAHRLWNSGECKKPPDNLDILGGPMDVTRPAPVKLRTIAF